MALSKKAAFRALVAKVRQKHGLSYRSEDLISEGLIQKFSESSQDSYKRFAEAYKAQEYKPGGHPDYNYLADPPNIGKTENGTITTLFLDLRNFTKYCCFLSPKDVYKAKSSVIEVVIGICHTYGGHLHEVPGDGVMFFFGGKDKNDKEAVRLALNAAADSMKLLEEEVIPEYNEEEKYPDIYPKMGLDYGDVLWGAYGADPYYEVKATAFNVDIAAKMMSQCRAREIAVGDKLKEYLELDDDMITKGWHYDRQLTVRGEKRKIFYQTWIFDWRKYLNSQDEDNDLGKLGLTSISVPPIITSKSKLGDAPLA